MAQHGSRAGLAGGIGLGNARRGGREILASAGPRLVGARSRDSAADLKRNFPIIGLVDTLARAVAEVLSGAIKRRDQHSFCSPFACAKREIGAPLRLTR